MNFSDLTNAQLKKIIRYFNHHKIVKGYSKMTRDELINHCQKHMTIVGNMIKLQAGEPLSVAFPKLTKKKAAAKKAK